MAVAAAALLCIGSGFIFRNCGSRSHIGYRGIVIVDTDTDSISQVIDGDSISYKSDKSQSNKGKRSRRVKPRKAATQKKEKAYPMRSPLDEPCD